jgi:RNA polymerase sigma-70 factor (ECF subfamily)
VELIVDDSEPSAVARSQRSWESEILVRLTAGDDLALNETYRQYGAYVYGLARRVTSDGWAAQEVAQEVFVLLWTEPHRVELERGSLRSWLGVVCHRRAVDWVRRQERQKRHQEAAEAQRHTVAPDVAEAATAMVEAEQVREAVASLPPDQRVAVELAYFGGLSYREVAERLGIPEGTAKSRLRLALSKLGDRLAPVGGGPA